MTMLQSFCGDMLYMKLFWQQGMDSNTGVGSHTGLSCGVSLETYRRFLVQGVI